MCLSTPTTTKSNSSSVVCNGSASANTDNARDQNANNNNNNNNNNNGEIVTCNMKPVCSDCTSECNSTSIKHRRKQISSSPTTTTTTTTVSNNETNLRNTKDLDDSLGYKEENAVYKEVTHAEEIKRDHNNEISKEPEYNPKIRWPDLIAQTFLHAGALYGIYLLFYVKLYTFLWVVLTIWTSGVGITAGAHRLWSHKSYTAALPLRILLVFFFTIAGQRDAYTWALDHRIHHKFSETEADPHNANRGFFFAHVGWLFLTPHPKVEEKRKVIDMSDLENDPVVMFQRKWYIPLFALISIGLPVLVPWYFWNENLWISFWVNFNLRFCCTLNVAFFVNSVAHMWGRKPYDKNIKSVENPIVSFLALGEGWHNYHHVFPWDYKTGEFGNYRLNMTTAFIDACAKLGWVTGRKSVSKDMIIRRAAKCGDGTRFLTDEYAHRDQVWGYGDRDLPKEDVAELTNMRD